MAQEKPEKRSKYKVVSIKGWEDKAKPLLLTTLYFILRHLRAWLPKRKWLRRLVVGSMILAAVTLGGMYGIARWYIWSERSQPYELGVSFIPDYAQYLGLNPETTLDALINQLHVRNFRLVSYWSDIEPTPGQYNFAELDREFAQIATVHGTVSLSIGLRQPRWPECHMPDWAANEPTSQWEGQLNQFMGVVINRYKSSPALQSYQLENEYFNKVFGACTNFDRSRLVSEFNLVKNLDPRHPVIIARSQNAIGIPIGQPTPDEFGVTVYKRVWNVQTRRYFEYPLPAWYYGFLAGVQKIVNHRDMAINELQAEPWAPEGKQITQISLAEQSKSLDAARLAQRFTYAHATGMKTVYAWGAEYWYYRLTTLHDPSVWNAAKGAFQNQK